ncbi:MAG: glucose-6-phosphate isomerase [Rhodospirillaceae bacterium]
MPKLTRSPAWQALTDHCKAIGGLATRDLFQADKGRFEALSFEVAGLLLDLSKNRINGETLDLLIALAQDRDLAGWRGRLFAGDPINDTEGRAAMHMALRGTGDEGYAVGGAPVSPAVGETLARMKDFAAAVQSGERAGATGKKFTDVINIGIGGSDRGPRLACRALKPYRRMGLNVHFVANVDATDVTEALHTCDPATTLIIISSKTFTTQETMTNAMTVRRWITEDLGSDAVNNHFIAVTGNVDAASDFGIKAENQFPLWDWVGGRFSIWSAVGLPVLMGIGSDAFRELLAGARDMDGHFRSAPLHENLPVLLGLVGVWNRNFIGASAHAVLPYDQLLEHLPSYLQQLEMESLGKTSDRAGDLAETATAPVVFGEAGTVGQHAFYQLLHQGSDVVSVDLIAAVESAHPAGDHHDKLLANFLAQGSALMTGRPDQEQPAHQAFSGNRPVTSILLPRLEPRTLGALLALYEHKVFVQSVIWNLNPFDQFGVELGKALAKPLVGALTHGTEPENLDGSTAGLLSRIRQWRDVES